MRLHLSISVRDGIGHVHLIHLVVELEIETHHVVRLWLVWVHFVDFYVVWRDIIVDIKTSLEPALPRLFVRLKRPERRLHAVIEEGVTLGEVNDVYSDHVSEVLWVSHLEVKPL